jgi:hypothetical protein
MNQSRKGRRFESCSYRFLPPGASGRASKPTLVAARLIAAPTMSFVRSFYVLASLVETYLGCHQNIRGCSCLDEVMTLFDFNDVASFVDFFLCS